jgi:hypothetical protein
MSTEFPNMSVEETTHISAFIAAFVVKPKRERWRTILAMKPEKWLGVSAYDCTEEPAADWNTPVADTLAKHNLTLELDRNAYVFPIGHGAGAPPYEGTLRGVFLSSDSELECVVSLVPGKFAVCYGHSGEVRICKR